MPSLCCAGLPSRSFMPRRVAWIILNHKRYEVDAGIAFPALGDINTTPNTLKDYFKTIYVRLEINSQQQLVERLSADLLPVPA